MLYPMLQTTCLSTGMRVGGRSTKVVFDGVDSDAQLPAVLDRILQVVVVGMRVPVPPPPPTSKKFGVPAQGVQSPDIGGHSQSTGCGGFPEGDPESGREGDLLHIRELLREPVVRPEGMQVRREDPPGGPRNQPAESSGLHRHPGICNCRRKLSRLAM